MDTTTSYRDFILNCIPKIKRYDQESFCWRTDGNGQEYAILTEMKAKHKDFADAIDGLDERLSRDCVSKYYEDYYTGVIATLMWGGYHKSKFNRLEKILSIGKDNIEKSVAKVDNLLSQNKIRDAFLALESGDCHINGIGVSYLTKILYFLGKGKSLPEQPLIYDSVQMMTHAALLIDDGAVDVKEYYARASKYSLRGLKRSVELYKDYIQRVNRLSKTCGLEPDQQEAYLFGRPLRGKVDPDNPRRKTRDFVLCYLKCH